MKIHISLRVNNLEDSLEFYRAFLGAEPHKVRSGYANFDLENPPLKLALNQMDYEEGGSLDHLGFVVDSRSEVASARQRLMDAGLTTFSEEEVSCCYATQDKVWATDPDGHAWEIYVLLDDAAEAVKDRPMTMLPAFRQSS